VHHKIILFVCVVILAGALVFRVSDSELYLFGYKWPIRCMLYETFGVKCALCGLTRSFCALAHSDFSAGVRFHPLGPALFAFVCLQVPYRIYRLLVKTDGAKTKLIRLFGGLNSGLAVIVVVAIFINWFIYLGGLIL
jgi:hypothetical protein